MCMCMVIWKDCFLLFLHFIYLLIEKAECTLFRKSTDVHPVIVPDLDTQANSASICCGFRDSLRKVSEQNPSHLLFCKIPWIFVFVSIFSACSVFSQGYFITLLRISAGNLSFWRLSLKQLCLPAGVFPPEGHNFGRNASLLSLLFLCHVFVGPWSRALWVHSQ